jgi:hypothetical protein
MKKLFFLVPALFISVALFPQAADTTAGPWKFTGITNLSLSQVSLVNWAQGGFNSLAINGLALLKTQYTKDKTTWANTLDLGYGIQKNENQDIGKTDDHLDFLSRYGYKTGKNWYLSGLLNFKTQFTKGYTGTDANRKLISDFMSPGYLLLAIGMEYKPNDKFYIMLSPIGGKATFVLDDTLSAKGSFGVDPGKKFRAEMGASARIGLIMDVMKNVTLATSLDLFSNLLDKPQNVDVNLKALLNLKVNEFLSANISITMIYDDNVGYTDIEGVSHGPRVQFKEILGVGLSVKF